MTQREWKQQRPEKWDEVKQLYLARKIKSDEAAQMLGISKAWFFRLMHRDDPGRKSFQTAHAKEMGKANKRFETYLEQNFSDYEICMMLKARDNCDRCPLSCKGYMKYKGLGRKLLEKVPLKAPSDISEEKI